MIIHDKLTLTHIAQAHPSWWVSGRMPEIDSEPREYREHVHCSVNSVFEWSPKAYELGLMVSKRRPENVTVCGVCYMAKLSGHDDGSDD